MCVIYSSKFVIELDPTLDSDLLAGYFKTLGLPFIN